MTDLGKLCEDYEKVEKAIHFIEQNHICQPELSAIAGNVNLSEYHFQRLFSRWTGISPKRFLQYLTKEYAKDCLQTSRNVMEAAFDAGLSGGSRLHDLLVTCEAVTPGEYKSGGEDLTIHYGFHPSPFGICFMATTHRGICALRFMQDSDRKKMTEWLVSIWPRANCVHSPEQTAPTVETVFDFKKDIEPSPLYLYIKGTNFQIKVWEALIKIPLGAMVTYADVAQHIGLPKAARAVGNAVGQNPIPFLIPCHRVIRKSGEFGNYGEGPLRKKALLGWEASRVAAFFLLVQLF